MKDYYFILGLKADATKDEIRNAYRKLSKKFHPDLNDGDKFFEDRFKDIQEAYEILIDDLRRQNYDETHNNGSKQEKNNKKKTSSSYSKPNEERKQTENYSSNFSGSKNNSRNQTIRKIDLDLITSRFGNIFFVSFISVNLFFFLIADYSNEQSLFKFIFYVIISFFISIVLSLIINKIKSNSHNLRGM